MEDGRPRLSSTTFARIVSIAGHPFLLVPLTIAVITRNWLWTGVIAAGMILPLTVIVLRKVRSGAWSDFDVSRPEQRSGLYFAAAPLLAVSAIILYVLDAGSRMMRGFAAATVMLSIGLLLGRWLKVSLHMMCAGLCAILILRYEPRLALPAALFVIAIAWSRWKLKRHTIAEILVGLCLGVAAGFCV